MTVEFEEALNGRHSKFDTKILQKTCSAEEVGNLIYQRLKSIDLESANAENPEDRTNYTNRFTFEKCLTIVNESLRQAKITDGRITDENKQKFLVVLRFMT